MKIRGSTPEFRTQVKEWLAELPPDDLEGLVEVVIAASQKDLPSKFIYQPDTKRFNNAAGIDCSGMYWSEHKRIVLASLADHPETAKFTLFHEIGHHVTYGNEPLAWMVYHIIIKEAERIGVTGSTALWAAALCIGLRPYSFSCAAEFLADSYALIHSRTIFEKAELMLYWERIAPGSEPLDVLTSRRYQSVRNPL